MARKAKNCPWCGRSRNTCWIMPCLVLDTILRRAPSNLSFERKLLAWGRAGGFEIRRAS